MVTEVMRARVGLREQLGAAIDTYVSAMVELFLEEALRAGTPGRRRGRPVQVIVRFDGRCLPANTNASAWVDGYAHAVGSALAGPAEPALLLMVAAFGLLTNASLPQDLPRGSIRRRGALRSVP